MVLSGAHHAAGSMREFANRARVQCGCVAAFQAFSRPGVQPVEFETGDRTEAQMWLTPRLMRPVYLPATPSAVRLLGARITPYPGAAAAFLVFGCPEHGSAQTIGRSVPGHPYPVSPARHSADGPTSDDFDPRDPARQRALLSEISDWLSREFGLPQSAKYPKLAFATPSELVRRRYRIIRSDTKLSSYEAPAQSNVARPGICPGRRRRRGVAAQDRAGFLRTPG